MNPQTAKHHNFRAIGLVSLSGILYGLLGYTGVKLLNQQFSIPAMLFWRFFIATLWMTALIRLYPAKSTAVRYLSISSLQAFLLGAICYSGSSLFYFMASRHIGTGLAMVVFFAYPVLVVLLNWLTGKQGFNGVTALSLALIGIGMLLLNQGKVVKLDKLGILLAILAAFTYAFYVFFSQYVVMKQGSTRLTQLVCMGSAAFFLIMSLPYQWAMPIQWESWLGVLVIGTICTAIPIQLLAEGLKSLDASKASIISVLEPLTTVLVGAVFLNETLSLTQMLGIIVILLGAILVRWI